MTSSGRRIYASGNQNQGPTYYVFDCDLLIGEIIGSGSQVQAGRTVSYTRGAAVASVGIPENGVVKYVAEIAAGRLLLPVDRRVQ